MRRHTIQTAIAILVLAAFLPLLATAQDISAMVDQALDQQVEDVEITDTPLPEALAALEQKTGLRFAIDADVLARMPYGEKTQVSITLRNVSVRRAMMQVCTGLGLTMRVAGDRVHLDPSPVLRRLGRRLTADEANLLAKLSSGAWKSLSPAPKLQFDVGQNATSRDDFEKALQNADGDSAVATLDAAAQAANCEWLPSGDAVLVTLPRMLITARLDQPIDLTYQRVALDEMLVDLGERIGVGIHFEPGALQAVGARDRLVDLIRRQTTVRQTLERLCGNTGLRYDVSDDGIHIAWAGASPTPGANAISSFNSGGKSQRRIVAHISVPLKDGAMLNVPVYDDELPSAELQRIREDALRTMRDWLRATGRP